MALHPRKPAFDWTAIPGVGPATVRDLELLAIRSPARLRGRDPLRLYLALCKKTNSRQDPCVLDVFLMLVHFAQTGEARPWWSFTKARKAAYPAVGAQRKYRRPKHPTTDRKPRKRAD